MALNKHSNYESIRSRCMKNAEIKYGKTLPSILKDRLHTELTAIKGNGYLEQYAVADMICEFSRSRGYWTTTRGPLGSALTAYLLEITDINPLPAHYRCPQCHYHEFTKLSSRIFGCDLPPKSCPVCNETLIRDGFNIIPEVSMGIDFNEKPNITINLAPGILPDAIKMLKEIYGEDNIVAAGVSVIKEEGSSVKGVHPGGIFIIPGDVSVNDITELREDVRDDGIKINVTNEDYHIVEKYFPKYDLLPSPILGHLHNLEMESGMPIKNITASSNALPAVESGINADLGDEQTFNCITSMMSELKSFSDFVRIVGLSHASIHEYCGVNNAQMIRRLWDMGITSRDDVCEFVEQIGLNARDAYSEMVRVAKKGKGLTEETRSIMVRMGIPQDTIGVLNIVRYLYPRSQIAAYALMKWRMMYYHKYYPNVYERICRITSA